MSIKKYMVSVLVVAGIITLVGYYVLGGFTERELELAAVNEYHLVGKEYKGTLGGKQLEEIFFEVQQRVQEGEPAGTFTMVVLREPKDENDTLQQFVGILLEDPSAAVPEGWQSFTLKPGQVVRSTIRSHNMVMPKPHAIREEMEAFAGERGATLQSGMTIEKYLGERHLEVEVPLEE